MRQDLKEWLLLMGKTVLVILGIVLTLAALVDLVVAGWSLQTGGILALGLLCVVPPIALAFRDAVRAAKEGRYPRGEEGGP